MLHAGAGSESQVRAALEVLCQQYWFPLYAYARREGRTHHEAQDCTQAFFEHLLASAGVADDVAALRAGPGGRRLVGIRHQVRAEADPAWLLRPDVLRGLAALGASGLAYDLVVTARELPAALEAARRQPGLTFVVEHLGVDESKVSEGASFIDDLGADSLDTVELVMAFEEEFGCEIPDDAAEKILTVKDAIAFIEQHA